MPTLDPIPEAIENEVHRLVFDVGLKAGMGALVLEFPFLGWPLISQAFTYVVLKIADAIYEPLSKFVKFSVIDARVDAERKAAEAALAAFKLAQTPEARKALEDSYARLIRLNP